MTRSRPRGMPREDPRPALAVGDPGNRNHEPAFVDRGSSWWHRCCAVLTRVYQVDQPSWGPSTELRYQRSSRSPPGRTGDDSKEGTKIHLFDKPSHIRAGGGGGEVVGELVSCPFRFRLAMERAGDKLHHTSSYPPTPCPTFRSQFNVPPC